MILRMSWPMNKRKIDNPQKAKIHIAIAELKLSDEVYRDILWTQFKAESCRDLSYNQGQKLLAHFEHTLGWKPRRKTPSSRPSPPRGEGGKKRQRGRPRPKGKNVTSMITPPQRRAIDNIAYVLQWDDENIRTWCMKQFGFVYPKTSGQASKVIKRMSKIRERDLQEQKKHNMFMS